MFGFIDSASEHAFSLAYFHNYAMFFLILVILFVIWILKLVLRFVVAERNLNPFTTKDVWGLNNKRLTYLFFMLLNSNKELSLLMFEPFYARAVALNITKMFYTYGAKKTMYPDQGRTINIFSITPKLVATSHEYRTLFNSGSFIKLWTADASVTGLTAELVNIYREALHHIPFLFPYERVEIDSHASYNSVEHYLILQLYVFAFPLKIKYLGWNKFLFRSDNLSIVTNWERVMPPINDFFGFINGRGRTSYKIFYKKYSVFVTPFLIFANFYGSEMRMFFYLFFQQVKHRKNLEWVWTCVPAAILGLILYPSLLLLYTYDRPYITEPYFTFKAIGHQWYWSYEYSDFVTSSVEQVGEHLKFDSYMLHQDDLEFGAFRLLEVDRRLVLPIGVCTRLIATSSDVLHSWAVPALGVKMDAVPGRLNQFWIVADRPGTFYGQCSELCGVNHGFMPIVTEIAPFVTFFKAARLAFNEQS